MTLWRLIVRSLESRPGRAVLTLGSIMIGVAGVVSVGLAVHTTRGAYQKMYDALAGRAALEVRAMGAGGFSADISEQVTSTPGVKSAAPSIQRITNLYHTHDGTKKKAKILAVGIDPALDREVRDYEILVGDFFKDGKGLLLEASFARSMGIDLHDEVRLLTPSGLKSVRVEGLLAPRGAAGFAQGAAAFLPLPVMQRFFEMRGKIDTLQLVLDHDSDEPAVRKAVAAILPTGVGVHPPPNRTEQADETLRSVEQALSVSGALSLVLAVFIIVNTFLMSVSERRKQWAIMRAIGATRSQVVRLLLCEGLMFGVIGTGLGLLAGLGGAYLLTRALEGLTGNPLPPIRLAWGPLALGGGLGLGLSLASTYFPALHAGRVSPLEGMRNISRLDTQNVAWWVTAIGVAMLAVGGGIVYAAGEGFLGRDKLVTGGVVCLLGCVPLLPAVLDPMTKVIAAVLAIGMPVETHLAAGAVLRRRVRTTLTAGVLFLAVGCGIGLAATIIDNVRDVQTWLRRTLQGDFFVRSMMPDINGAGAQADLPDSLATEIRKIPGVTAVTSALSFRGRAEGEDVLIMARQFLPGEPLPMFIKDADPKEVVRRLAEGQVVIGTVLAQKTGRKVGDMLKIETSHGPRTVKIAGMNNDYNAGGMTVYFEREAAKKFWDIHGATLYVIKAHVQQLAAVDAALAAITDREGLLFQSSASVFRMINGMMMGVVGGLWVLLALALLVASFGIVNTLTMNVLEQTREIGLLCAVAMTRRQMRWMILIQAAIIGLIGLFPGVLAGAVLAFLMNTGTLPLLGHPINFNLSPALLVVTFTGAIVMVLLAAWAPALRASRLNVIVALRQD